MECAPTGREIVMEVGHRSERDLHVSRLPGMLEAGRLHIAVQAEVGTMR
jgi:hypothetical protein